MFNSPVSIQILDVNEEYADFLHDESRREGRAEKIVFPTTTEEVCDALATAVENGWSVTVQGGRTGITGGCVPEGGLILNLSRMKQIGDVDHPRLTVQPGAVLSDIRANLEGTGFFFPSDLTETSATIGGMIANNASGARSFRYGSVRPWIYGVTVVLPNGEVVKLERGIHRAAGYDFQLGSVSGRLPDITRPLNIKSAAGYFVQPNMDLVDLFIGSEGTLGIVTEVTLQLLPLHEAITGLTAFFATESQALEFVGFLREFSKPLAIELFDKRALDLLRTMKAEHEAFSDLPELKPEHHTALYFEYEGEVPVVVIDEIEQQALDCWMADNASEIDTLKKFRHAIPESVNLLISERKKEIPALTKLGTDMAVPDDRLEEMMQMYHGGLAEAGLEYVIFGHIGDNHVHVNILPRNLEEYETGKALYLDWARQVVEWGGSISAEHGVGKIKIEFLRLMFGDEGIQSMRGLKALFDPQNVLNPGNLFEINSAAGSASS